MLIDYKKIFELQDEHLTWFWWQTKNKQNETSGINSILSN